MNEYTLSRDELLQMLKPENISAETIHKLAYTILYAMGQFYWVKIESLPGSCPLIDKNGHVIYVPTIEAARTMADNYCSERWSAFYRHNFIMGEGDIPLEQRISDESPPTTVKVMQGDHPVEMIDLNTYIIKAKERYEANYTRSRG